MHMVQDESGPTLQVNRAVASVNSGYAQALAYSQHEVSLSVPPYRNKPAPVASAQVDMKRESVAIVTLRNNKQMKVTYSATKGKSQAVLTAGPFFTYYENRVICPLFYYG